MRISGEFFAAQGFRIVNRIGIFQDFLGMGPSVILGVPGCSVFLNMRVIIETALSLDLGIALFASSGLSGCFGSYDFMAVTGYLDGDWSVSRSASGGDDR